MRRMKHTAKILLIFALIFPAVLFAGAVSPTLSDGADTLVRQTPGEHMREVKHNLAKELDIRPELMKDDDPEKVDVKKIVLEHIGDSHEWHITSIGEKHISIPLPVIVRGSSGQWHCFLSSKFHHGHESYKGFSIAHEGENEGRIVELLPDGSYYVPLDLSITKTVAGLFINCLLLLWLVLWMARKYSSDKPDTKARAGFAGMIEFVIEFVMDEVIKPCVGKNYLKFAPFLLTAFFFILINNLMGLVPIFPAGTNVTGNIAVTLVLAVSSFLAINIFGSKHYWKDIFWPEVPAWLKVPIPLMPVIELVGIFTKPFSLMIRLFANILAGHAVILILTCIVFATVSMGSAINGSMTLVSVMLTIFMNCLELMVAFLQAFVFTMLSAVFIGFAQLEGEHASNEHGAKE